MIDTHRLTLRPWRDGDRQPFAAMGRDARVMRHLGPLLDTQDSDGSVDRMMALQHDHGMCFWAVERRADGRFLGFCGLKPGPADTPLHGATEIGWRFGSAHWGQGYAREAAEASLAWGWAKAVPRVMAMTVDANTPSWGLMVRLGMRRRPDLDFDHPALPAGSPLRRHIVYDLERPQELP